MIILKLNILKKITLGLSTIICTCALYSNANADQEVIDNESIILQQEESIDALFVNSNIDNITNYDISNSTIDDKKKTSKSAKIGVFTVIGVASAVGLALAGLGTRKVYSKFKAKRDAEILAGKKTGE